MAALIQLLLNKKWFMFFLSVRVYLYLNLSIENAKNADAPGLKSILEITFNRFGITRYYNKLVGINLDGASINMGKHNGLNVLLRDEAPWLRLSIVSTTHMI